MLAWVPEVAKLLSLTKLRGTRISETYRPESLSALQALPTFRPQAVALRIRAPVLLVVKLASLGPIPQNSSLGDAAVGLVRHLTGLCEVKGAQGCA